MARTGVIIVAGGQGQRMGGSIPKQFRLLGCEPLLSRTIRNFAEALPGAQIVVVLPAEHIAFWHNLCKRFDVAAHTTVEGGTERFHSVKNGVAALDTDTELIAVQDGVRPLTSGKLIQRIAATAAQYGTAIPVIEAVDSYRATDCNGSHAIDRRQLRIVQTPQMFRADLLREAYTAQYRSAFTDDASVIEAAGHTVHLCEGERQNLKITTADDLIIAEALLTACQAPEATPDDTHAEHL